MLLVAYRDRAQGTYLSARETQSLRNAAEGLFLACTHETLEFPCNIDDSHWTAVVIDATTFKICYGDSFGTMVSPFLKDAINWWLSHHVPAPLDWDTLEVSRQEDSHSCGLFAINAIAHYIHPSKFLLLSPLLEDTDTARMHFGYTIIDRHVSSFFSPVCTMF
jgi:Ulp1 family protease